MSANKVFAFFRFGRRDFLELCDAESGDGSVINLAGMADKKHDITVMFRSFIAFCCALEFVTCSGLQSFLGMANDHFTTFGVVCQRLGDDHIQEVKPVCFDKLNLIDFGLSAKSGLCCQPKEYKKADTIVFYVLVVWKEIVFPQPAQWVLDQIGGTVLNREAVVQDSPGSRSAPWEPEETQCLRELRRSSPKGDEDVWTTSSRLGSIFLSSPGCASRPWAILDNRFAVENVLPKSSPKEQSSYSNSSHIENGRVSKKERY